MTYECEFAVYGREILEKSWCRVRWWTYDYKESSVGSDQRQIIASLVSDCRSIKRAVPLAVYLKDKSTKLKVKGDCTVGMGSIPGLHNYESGGDSITVTKQLRAT
jgi:hypothetical protein